MPKENDALQASYVEAKTVCREKLSILEKGLGKMDAEVRDIDKGMKNTFFKLDNPNLWKTEINFDSAVLSGQVKLLAKLGQNDLKGIVLNINKVLDMLREIESGKPVSTAAPAIAMERAELELTAPVTNPMNSEVRNALLLTQRQIQDRIDQFDDAEPPVNLFDDPDFITKQARHIRVTGEFDRKLVSNAITGTAADRDTIKGAGNDIAATTDVPGFKGAYTKLDDFIEGRLPVV